MKKPRFSIRAFLLLCLLLGAVGVPWAWRTYQARRAAEIERLEKELSELLVNQPTLFPYIDYGRDDRDDPVYLEYLERARRVEQIEDRLEKLTGKRPEPPDMDQVRS